MVIFFLSYGMVFIRIFDNCNQRKTLGSCPVFWAALVSLAVFFEMPSAWCVGAMAFFVISGDICPLAYESR